MRHKSSGRVGTIVRGFSGFDMLCWPLQFTLRLLMRALAVGPLLIMGSLVPWICMPMAFVMCRVEVLAAMLQGRTYTVRDGNGKTSLEWFGPGTSWAWHAPRSAVVNVGLARVVQPEMDRFV